MGQCRGVVLPIVFDHEDKSMLVCWLYNDERAQEQAALSYERGKKEATVENSKTPAGSVAHNAGSCASLRGGGFDSTSSCSASIVLSVCRRRDGITVPAGK